MIEHYFPHTFTLATAQCDHSLLLAVDEKLHLSLSWDLLVCSRAHQQDITLQYGLIPLVFCEYGIDNLQFLLISKTRNMFGCSTSEWLSEWLSTFLAIYFN